MKKIVLLYLSLFSIISFVAAKEVNEQQAKEYALNFIEARSEKDYDITSINIINDAYYIINMAPQGWLIIAADDVVTPVIGYSFVGSLKVEEFPDNMQFMMKEFEVQVNEIVQRESSPHPYWQSATATITRAADNKIEPLIQVNWNQSSPFNKYCPQQKAVVGCVAVSMAQAMSVQRYPARPKGQVSYTSANYGGMRINFDDERAYSWDDIFNPDNDNYDEVARLLFHTGMSVRMDYGEDGSGIPSNEASRISNALVNHFSYSDDIRCIWRDSYSGDWALLMLNELNAGRAVVYNAIDSYGGYGHSFNVDGYDGEGLFNVNWGWGGYGNGYFSINNLRDSAMGMNYDAHHVVIVGIGAPDQLFKSISLSNNRIEEGLPAGSVVGSILVNGKEVKSQYQVVVHGTYDSKTGSYSDVPFVWEDGMLKTTEPLVVKKEPWNVEITVSDPESGASLTQGFRIVVDEWKDLGTSTSLKYDRGNKLFYLSTKHNVSYSIINSLGIVVESGILEPLPELVIDVNRLSDGENVIELKCVDEVKQITLIKNNSNL